MKELSKDSKFSISIETLVVIGGVIVTVVGMWFTLNAEIQEAKKLPPSEVSRTEYDLKDQLIRSTILNIEEKVDANGIKLDKIEERLYQMQ